MKRHKIVSEQDSWKYRGKHLEGKEVFMYEMTICSSSRNKYSIIVWTPDCYQEEPHLHIVDTKTYGNEVNCAYSLISGKPVKKHGSVIDYFVSKRILSYINKMLQKKLTQTIIINHWNSFGNTCKQKIQSIPVLINKGLLT